MTQREAAIIWLDEAGADAAALLGGKFGSLVDLAGAGFSVPPGFGVTTAAYEAFMDAADLHGEVRRLRATIDRDDLAGVNATSARIAALIEGADLPADLERDIRAAYARLEERAGVPDVPVAVRSSGVAEDLAGASFAGQYDTYLWITGADAVLRYVRRCWTGLFGPAVLTYKPEGDTAPEELPEWSGMGVGVQQMVDARSAGVVFTLDPVSGDRSKIVLEACWGLGEGVVKGDVAPDRFRVDKVTLEVLAREIATQEQEYRFRDGEVGLTDVPEERRAQPSLQDDEVVAVSRLAKQVERHRGAPQDIEWAVDRDGEIRLLQARPETVWSRRAGRPVTEGSGSAVQRVLSKFMTGARAGGKEGRKEDGA